MPPWQFGECCSWKWRRTACCVSEAMMMGCAVQHKGPGASNRWEEESGTAGGPTALLPFSWWCLSDSPACRQVVPSATFIEEEKQNNKSHVFQHGQIQKALSGSFYIQLYYYIQLIKSPILWVKLAFRCNKFLLPPRTKKKGWDEGQAAPRCAQQSLPCHWPEQLFLLFSAKEAMVWPLANSDFLLMAPMQGGACSPYRAHGRCFSAMSGLELNT